MQTSVANICVPQMKKHTHRCQMPHSKSNLKKKKISFLFFLKIYFFVQVYVFVWMYIMYTGYPRRPGEGMGPPRSGITGGCAPPPPTGGVGAENQSPPAAFCKICNYS